MKLRLYKNCPVCNCRLRVSRFDKHMESQHSEKAEFSRAIKEAQRKKAEQKKVKQQDMLVKCGYCTSLVKEKNLAYHRKKQHGTTARPPRKSANKSQITPETARQLLKIMEETRLVQDKEISNYINQHPVEDKAGKYGVPQDKYRFGFYGSRSMAYDLWRKGEKPK